MPPEDPSPKGPSFGEKLVARLLRSFVRWREFGARSWGARAVWWMAVYVCIWIGREERSVGPILLAVLLILPVALPSLREAIQEVRERDRESDPRRKAGRPPEER